MTTIFFPCGNYEQLRIQKDANDALTQNLITQHLPAAQPLWDLVNHELNKDDLQEKFRQELEFSINYVNLTTNLVGPVEELIARIILAEFLLRRYIRSTISLVDILTTVKENKNFLATLHFNADYLIARLQSRWIGGKGYLRLIQSCNEKYPIDSCIINELAIIGSDKAVQKIINSGYVPDEIVLELVPFLQKRSKEKVLQLALALKYLEIPIYLVGDLANLLYQTEFILGLAKTIQIVQAVYGFHV